MAATLKCHNVSIISDPMPSVRCRCRSGTGGLQTRCDDDNATVPIGAVECDPVTLLRGGGYERGDVRSCLCPNVGIDGASTLLHWVGGDAMAVGKGVATLPSTVDPTQAHIHLAGLSRKQQHVNIQTQTSLTSSLSRSV